MDSCQYCCTISNVEAYKNSRSKKNKRRSNREQGLHGFPLLRHSKISS